MPTKNTLKQLRGAPEVDNNGVYPRGGKSKQKLVTEEYSSDYGNFKKNLVMSVIFFQSAVIFTGLASEWIDWYVHLAYIVGSVSVMGLVTLALSKVK